MNFEVSGDVDEEVQELFDATREGDSPSPSALEIAELASRRGARIRVVKIMADGMVEGASICSIREGQLSGLPVKVYGWYGQDLHDYGRIPARSSAGVDALMEATEKNARDSGCDLVYLDNVLLDSAMLGATRAPVQFNEYRLFRPSAGENGWDELLRRKSLRRHWRSVERQPGFKVGWVEGTHPREFIEELARLHRERWAFDGSPSAFDNPARVDDYLTWPANKVLVTVNIGRELVCVLFAMRYGRSLLWHTPVINLKYLEHSPLEVLLTATAHYCQSSGIDCIDFGLGGEDYKERFANDVRRVGTILRPVTIRGLIVWFAHKGKMGERVKRMLIAGRAVVSRQRARIVALSQTIRWYERTGEAMPPAEDPPGEVKVLRSFPAFVDFAREHKFPLRRYQYQRFRDGAFFAAIHLAGEAIAHGWMKACDDFFVGEIGRTVSARERVVLFDFETRLESRGRGYYPKLLRALISLYEGKRVAIFVRTSNAPSIAAIERVGFHRVAEFSGMPRWRRAALQNP